MFKLPSGFIRIRRSNDTNNTEKQVNNLPGPNVSKKSSDKQSPSIFQRLSNFTRNTFRTSNKATDDTFRPANNFPGPSLSNKTGQTSLMKRISNTTRNVFHRSNAVSTDAVNAGPAVKKLKIAYPWRQNRDHSTEKKMVNKKTDLSPSKQAKEHLQNGQKNEKPKTDQLKQKNVLKGKVSDKQKIDLSPAKEQGTIQKKKDPLPIKQAKDNAFKRQENVPKKKDPSPITQTISPAKQTMVIVPRGWETVQKKRDPSPAKQAKEIVPRGRETVQKKRDLSPTKQAKEIVPRGQETVQNKRDPSPAKQAKDIVPRGRETVQKKRDLSPTKQAKEIVPRGQVTVQNKRDLSPTKQAKDIVPRGRETMQKKRDPSPAKQAKDIVLRGRETVQNKRDLSPTKQAKDIVPRGRESVQNKRDPSPTKQAKDIVPRGRVTVQIKRDPSPAKQAKDIVPRGWETVQKKRDPSPAKQPEQGVKTVQCKHNPSPAKQTMPIITREQGTVQHKKDLSPTKEAKEKMAKQQETVQQKKDPVPAIKIDTKPNQETGQAILKKKIEPSPVKHTKGNGSMVQIENALPMKEQQNDKQKVQGAVRRIDVLPAKEANTLPNQQRTENKRNVQLPEEQKKVIPEKDFSPMNKIENQTPQRQNSVKQNKDKKPEMQINNLKVQFAETIAKPQITLKQLEVEKSVKKKSLISIEDFRLGRMLGQGSYGRVFLALHKPSKRNFAIKALSKTKVYYGGLTKNVMLEKKVLKMVNEAKNPFLIGLFAAFQTEHHLCLATELLNGGDLHSAIQKKLSNESIVFYAACIVNGLQFLHNNKIVHRDIKPENILLDKRGYARIADFGLAKEGISYDTVITGICGTTNFMAPEMFSQPYYNQAVDWWALGVTIYEMATGELPFDSQDRELKIAKIVFKQPYYPADLPADTRSIIEALLEKSPLLRLGSSRRGAEDVKSHPFFKKINWEALMKKQVKPPTAPKVSAKPSATKPVLTDEKFDKPITEAMQEAFKEFDEPPCSGKNKGCRK